MHNDQHVTHSTGICRAELGSKTSRSGTLLRDGCHCSGLTKRRSLDVLGPPQGPTTTYPRLTAQGFLTSSLLFS